MSDRFAAFDAHVEENKDRFIEELRDYCRTPCITGQGVGVRESADLTAAVLQGHGIPSRVLETDGAPVVYGETGSGEKTLLIYDHYDVQPPEPLELWESEPFAAEVRDGKIFARGVADNRGDAMARAQAIQTYREAIGELPVKVKFLIEGEEEIGSPSLPAFVERNRELLQADGCLWEAGSRDEVDRVLIALGLKGVLHCELRVSAAKVDLHSSLATIVPNAAWRLTWALASLKSPDDEILVDGLMDHVFEPTPQQIDLLRGIPFAEEKMKEDLGIPAFNQELTGIDLLRKHLYEPTCTIQGLASGYSGVGLKAVSPCEAMAKVEFRLVPNLEPDLVWWVCSVPISIAAASVTSRSSSTPR
jgi:acetylornithine deacetylase/succinyl-diaminopimelate desuccinylase-like protein